MTTSYIQNKSSKIIIGYQLATYKKGIYYYLNSNTEIPLGKLVSFNTKYKVFINGDDTVIQYPSTFSVILSYVFTKELLIKYSKIYKNIEIVTCIIPPNINYISNNSVYIFPEQVLICK